MTDYNRSMDQWLKYAVIIAPIVTYVLGVGSGAIWLYKVLGSDGIQISLIRDDVSQLQGWKGKQEDFNQKTVSAISRLQALIKDTKPSW